jgi:NAD(P)H-quinone oxidoreductase subunit 5
MSMFEGLSVAMGLAPVGLMLMAALLSRFDRLPTPGLWKGLLALSGVALLGAAVSVGSGGMPLLPGLKASSLGLALAVLVQLLGTVIAAFSARYLQGEPGQRRYVSALAMVLAMVHLLLLADHWVVLIVAWAGVGAALRPLLCFYPDRAFARLADHKKQIADRAADVLLILAAVLAWAEVGSGSLTALADHVARTGLTAGLQGSAVALVLAVVLRTALLPVHGWLIQVMEAPTPVSALLHAGVVNLGGFVLIRFAPLLDQAMVARVLLLAFGLATAVLAGMVMLTRISIKVRLAWSTVAQMGFMLVECALGLYTLAALHLIGHSLYKAHAFLCASGVVRHTRLQSLHIAASPHGLSLGLAPVLAVSAVLGVQWLVGLSAWPWWWSVLLGLAWAPLLWAPAGPGVGTLLGGILSGALMVTVLTLAALGVHALPLGVPQTPVHDGLGLVALLGMGTLYAGLMLLQVRPAWLTGAWRWSYAGFYLDEAYTRLALRCGRARWAPPSRRAPEALPVATLRTDTL